MFIQSRCDGSMHQHALTLYHGMGHWDENGDTQRQAGSEQENGGTRSLRYYIHLGVFIPVDGFGPKVCAGSRRRPGPVLGCPI